MKPIAIIFAVLGVIVIVAITIVVTQSGDPAATPPDTNQSTGTNSGENAPPGTKSPDPTTAPSTGKAGKYIDYNPETFEAELMSGNRIVLSFSASWCPFCRAADQEFRKRAAEIPSDVTIIKLNYDTSTELKKKYGVTYQHTFVQINSHGEAITKWSGGDIAALKQNIK